MKKTVLSMLTVAAVLLAGPALAADPIVGTWKLNVEKSKFGASSPLKAGTRTYTEKDGLYTLDQKVTTAEGKELSSTVTYREGKEEKQANEPGRTTLAKKTDANTWDFELKRSGKVVGHVHRVVSTDGKTLTVHDSGEQLSGRKGDETLVFDKQ